MKKLGWKGHGLGKENQGALQFEVIKDKSVNPKKVNIQWIMECKNCQKLNIDINIHIECTGCGLVFNDFIKFLEDQTFDTTQENVPEKPSHIAPIENVLERIEEPDSSTNSNVKCDHCFKKYREHKHCYCPEAIVRQNADLESGSEKDTVHLDSDSDSDRNIIHLDSDSSSDGETIHLDSDSEPIHLDYSPDDINWVDAEFISDVRKKYYVKFEHPESKVACRAIECMRCYEHHKSAQCKMGKLFVTSEGTFPYYCAGDTREWIHEINLETGEKVRICKKHVGEKEVEKEIVFLGSFKKVGNGRAGETALEGSRDGTESDPICID